MTKLIVFSTLSLFFIMALLPFRIQVLADYGHPYAAGEEEYYLACLSELNKLKTDGADEEKVHHAMLKLARSLISLRQYQRADQIYSEIWNARAKSTAAYDETFVLAVMGLAALRRDTSNIVGAITCYSVALAYDKKRLPAKDKRLTRDKTNLAIALSLAGKTAKTAERKLFYQRSVAGFLAEAIAEQKERQSQGSIREANARQDLAYVLKDMGDKQGYEKEIRLARNMQRRLNTFSLCREP